MSDKYYITSHSKVSGNYYVSFEPRSTLEECHQAIKWNRMFGDDFDYHICIRVGSDEFVVLGSFPNKLIRASQGPWTETAWAEFLASWENENN